MGDETAAAERSGWILPWDALTAEQQAHRARDMEIYAGMIDYLDHSVGRLLNHLRDLGVYENTLAVFLSDNGPSKTAITDYLALGGDAAEFARGFDNSLANKGRPGSSTDIGPGWAFASATPLRLFKGYVTQGGIQVPAIVKAPRQRETRGTRITTPIYITDLVPTLLEAAGVAYPESYNGLPLAELYGRSLLRLLETSEDDSLQGRGAGWEAYGMDAWRQDNWKLVRLPPPFGTGEWQLYDLDNDPGETTDVADLNRGLTTRLSQRWEVYAGQNEVVHPDEPIAYGKSIAPGKF
ncbi:MAG: sulfatase-like hydrolase/transferase [Hyphomicrobiales bacterium]|nr:sulfatase-like hydrolase/transferase [Hyphomicrobiales bacterium]